MAWKMGHFIMVEQPVHGLLFTYRPMRRLMFKIQAHLVSFSMCVYGAPSKKSTQFLDRKFEWDRWPNNDRADVGCPNPEPRQALSSETKLYNPETTKPDLLDEPRLYGTLPNMGSLWRNISKLTKQHLQDLKHDGLEITRRYIGDDGREKVVPSLPIGWSVVIHIS